MRYFLLLVCLIDSVIACAQASPTDYNDFFKPVKWRNIGPFRGGRSVSSCGVVGDPMTYYMGTTGGGLWKTADMGITWNNISDGFFKTGSVGAVAVSESDPNVVFVGMGEHAIRGVMTSSGDGVYKSDNAGKTWRRVGLELSQHIARIVIHPTNPDVAWVAVQGALYGASNQRGIYKTTDGGITWKNVLFVNDMTGCAELSLDRNNPRILYAAMWHHGRLPWQVISGGAGSGLYKSTDGGETWQRLSQGLPKEMGKMSIAVCPSNSSKVYALIESDSDKEAGGLFVSNDAGDNWSRVTNNHRLVQRAWYYIELFIDPKHDKTLYVLSAPALRSEDGGNTWTELEGTHGDYHDLWINPHNPNNMIISDDGGAAITFNYGRSWSSQENMPTGQFYRINVDNQFPYRIYAGQQDNSSVSIASRELGGSHISTSSWTYAAGGESAFLAFNPDDPRLVMGGSYQGTIEVLDINARAATNIMAAPIQYLGRDAKDMKYRFNWNAPIICSRHEPNTFYHGGQVLLKTQDLGKTWKEVSPDLTRNDKSKQGRPGVPYTNEAVGAENYGTLSYVIESITEKGVIWTGSDDGLVHLTMDGGVSWKNVTPPGLQECLINAIEVSPHDKATAYIATTRYKFNDHTPGIYKTTDYGKTWTKIIKGIPDNAFTRVVREDEVRKDLLFAGTETGLYISYTGGKDWSPFQLNLPVTPITDLRVHQGDLIASTSGRAFWILDDLGLIRQYGQLNGEAILYKPEDAPVANGRSELDRTKADFSGMDALEGVNPANGLVLYYLLPELPSDAVVTLTIKDASSGNVRYFSSEKDTTYLEYEGAPPANPVLTKHRGLNRLVWDMRYPTMAGVPYTYFENSFKGHKAGPGDYLFGLKTSTQLRAFTTAKILQNPLYPFDQATQAAYHEIMQDMEIKLDGMHRSVNNLKEKRDRLEKLVAALMLDGRYKSVLDAGRALIDKMRLWDEEMVQRKSKAYDDVENFPNKFTANYLFLINQTESDLPRVNQPCIELKAQLDQTWALLRERLVELLEKDIPAFNKMLWEIGIGGVW
jgi:photosystem II stability/assembly factor-like uncharacterized protein